MMLPDAYFRQLAKTKEHLVLGVANTPKNDPQWITHLYNPLSLSLGGTSDLHLTNGLCHKWQDVTPLIRSHYITGCYSHDVMLYL